MQAPICEVCLKSSILCSACQEKVDIGKVQQIEIDVSRFLFNLSEKVKSLSDVKVAKIIDAGVLLIIGGRGDGAKLVGKRGLVVKALAKKFNKSIRVLEEAENFKKFAEELISPLTLSGINTLYTSGKQVHKFRISPSQKDNLIITPKNFSEVIFDLYNRKAEIVFET